MVEDGGVVGRRAAGVRVVVAVGAVVGVRAVRVALGCTGPAVAAVSAAWAVGRADSAVTQMSDLAGRAVGDEPAVLQEDRPLDDVGELTHLVQNRHQGQPLRAQPLKDLGQGLAAGAVDAGQRLIEDEQLGGADQGPGDEDPLGLPAGEDLDVVRGPERTTSKAVAGTPEPAPIRWGT